MNDINKWFYSLTLNELQEYIVKLETKNERLMKELKTTSKINCILENVTKSTQTGYSILRRIEINKSCECNEHLNTNLRKSLNDSINQTNLLLNHLQLFHSCEQSDNCIPRPMTPDDQVVDLTTEPRNQSTIPFNIRHSFDDKDSVSMSSPSSSGYESTDYTTEQVNRGPNPVFHNMYTTVNTTESHSSIEDLSQKSSKPKSPQLGPNTANPIPERSLSSPLSNTTFPSSGVAMDKTQHLPNKCTECDLSFNLKQSLEKHLLTHVSINPTFTLQRAGRGRPAKNDSRILRVTDSDLNILRMNDGLGSLPVSLSALEELRRQKFTGFGRYRCPWPDCGYTPHFLRDLRRHMFKHTGDKKYKCDFDNCDFITVWKTSLLQHQRKKHNFPDTQTNTQKHEMTNFDTNTQSIDKPLYISDTGLKPNM